MVLRELLIHIYVHIPYNKSPKAYYVASCQDMFLED